MPSVLVVCTCVLWCILPDFSPEREAVREAMLDTLGEAWIVKPASSACGRGIYITKNVSDLPGQKRAHGSGSGWGVCFLFVVCVLVGSTFDRSIAFTRARKRRILFAMLSSVPLPPDSSLFVR